MCLSQQPLSPHHTLPCVLEDMFSIGISLGVFSSLVKNNNNNNNFCLPTYYQLSPLTWFCSPLLTFDCKIRPTTFPFIGLDWQMCWHWEPWTQSVCISLPLISQGSFCVFGPGKNLPYRSWCRLSSCLHSSCEMLSGVNRWSSLGCPS